jgi:hypothetical protein
MKAAGFHLHFSIKKKRNSADKRIGEKQSVFIIFLLENQKSLP